MGYVYRHTVSTRFTLDSGSLHIRTDEMRLQLQSSQTLLMWK